MRGGLLALVTYFAFVLAHLRHLARAGAAGRAGIAFLLAALVMGMGGPQPSSSWFFLALGALFYRATASQVPAVARHPEPRPVAAPA